MLNLLENSTDAQVGGKVCIKTILDNEKVSITVRDEGSGIPEESLTRIFEPLYTTKNGLGLGLWITHSIIKRNKGKIVVESCWGQGALFTVKLPTSE
jgi:signal transduction histidine kinase